MPLRESKPPQGNLARAERDTVIALASQGIDKNLAKQARALGSLGDAAFERKVGGGA